MHWSGWLPSSPSRTGTRSLTTVPLALSVCRYHNFDMVSSLYPECKFVWFGDSGQGDLETGCMMMERKRDQMLAVYIHDIVEAKGVTPKVRTAVRGPSPLCSMR